MLKPRPSTKDIIPSLAIIIFGACYTTLEAQMVNLTLIKSEMNKIELKII
jgi:hypothetical protein